jgi:hypothetical protein
VTVAAKLIRSWFVCWFVLNPLWFHELPGYTGLSLLNYLLQQMIFLLNFISLVGSVTATIVPRVARPHGADRSRVVRV